MREKGLINCWFHILGESSSTIISKLSASFSIHFHRFFSGRYYSRGSGRGSGSIYVPIHLDVDHIDHIEGIDISIKIRQHLDKEMEGKQPLDNSQIEFLLIHYLM